MQERILKLLAHLRERWNAPSEWEVAHQKLLDDIVAGRVDLRPPAERRHEELMAELRTLRAEVAALHRNTKE